MSAKPLGTLGLAVRNGEPYLREALALPDKVRAAGLVRGAVRSRDEMVRELVRAVGRGSPRAVDA